MIAMTRSASTLALLLLAACSANNPAPEAESTTVAGRPPLVRPETLPRTDPTMQSEVPIIPGPADTGAQATVARLEREARAIARTTGCGRASDCRTAPVGARACGGPRTYIVYCAATTDTVALTRKLRELERVEKDWLARSGTAGTCEMRMAPSTMLVGASCREAAAGAGVDRVP